MDAAPGNAHTCLQGLTDRIHAFERWQQGWVDVDQFSRKGIDEHRGDNPHPARHHHSFHTRRLEGANQFVIQGFTAVELSMIKELAGNAEAFCSRLGTTSRTIDHQKTQLGIQIACMDRCLQSLKVCARSRRHHTEAQGALKFRPWSDGGNRERGIALAIDLASVGGRGHSEFHVPSLHPAHTGDGSRFARDRPACRGLPCAVRRHCFVIRPSSGCRLGRISPIRLATGLETHWRPGSVGSHC